MRTITIISIVTLLIASAARAVETPQQARVVKGFDFEERRLGNAEDLPMHWQKRQGSAYPHYVNGRLTTDRHRSGDYSFRMDLDGGSCAYQYDPIRIAPGGHYRMSAFCQTTPMEHARARLSLQLFDQDLRPIGGATRHSETFASWSVDDTDWHPLSVEISADEKTAAFMVVSMELLQPEEYAGKLLGNRSLFVQDIRGTAWFDDVEVSQVPMVTLTTNRPANVFRKSDPLTLTAEVNDRSIDDLSVQLVLTDAADRLVYQRTGNVDLKSAVSIGTGIKRVVVGLPEVVPGWYRATLEMTSGGVVVGRQALDFIRLADEGLAAPPDARFGVIATGLPFALWDQLPGVLPMISTGRVKLAVWGPEGDVQQMDAGKLDSLLQSLQQQGVSPTACLLSPPPMLQETFSGSSWLAMVNAPSRDWANQLSFMISRNAAHLEHWQLGGDNVDDFATSPQQRQVYQTVYAKFAELLDKPDVAMPCPIWFEANNPPPASVALAVPSSILPKEIPLYLADYKSRPEELVSVSLFPPEKSAYGRLAQIRDLTQRVVYSLSADARRIDVPLPVEVTRQGEVDVPQPTEMLLILRTLFSSLSGTTFKGKLPIADDIEAFLFDRNGVGVVVLWAKDDVKATRPLSINLGEHPVRLDLWGNASPLPKPPLVAGDDPAAVTSRAAAGTVQLSVGRMPVMIVGVDSEAGQLRTSLQFDQPLMESSFQTHVRHLKFTNPYSQPTGGYVRLHGPPGWTMTPPSFSFNLNPGETFDREVTISFPYNSVAGPVKMYADVMIDTDRRNVFTMPLALTLGLSDVGTEVMAFRDGADIVVQQMITNYGDKPINYTAFAAYPGRPRIERLVASLPAGKTAMKKYRFVNTPSGPTPKIRVGLKESEGTRILNDEVQVR